MSKVPTRRLDQNGWSDADEEIDEVMSASLEYMEKTKHSINVAF